MANEALPEGDGVALEWNNHNNDIGDWCPYSGDPVGQAELDDHGEDGEDGARCPQWCMKSGVEEVG
ncbi:MAG: hypothetical protein ACRDRL_25010 [Sciscionella sp.]